MPGCSSAAQAACSLRHSACFSFEDKRTFRNRLLLSFPAQKRVAAQLLRRHPTCRCGGAPRPAASSAVNAAGLSDSDCIAAEFRRAPRGISATSRLLQLQGRATQQERAVPPTNGMRMVAIGDFLEPSSTASVAFSGKHRSTAPHIRHTNPSYRRFTQPDCARYCIRWISQTFNTAVQLTIRAAGAGEMALGPKLQRLVSALGCKGKVPSEEQDELARAAAAAAVSVVSTGSAPAAPPSSCRDSVSRTSNTPAVML